MEKFRPDEFVIIWIIPANSLLLSQGGFSNAIVAQLVEHVIGNDEVTSSILVNGSLHVFAKVAQLVEHVFRKDGAAGSIPAFGSLW